jgi:hypothetical protein
MRKTKRKKDNQTNMTNTQATETDKAATVAAQRAQGTPEKVSSKKGATQKKGAPKGQRVAKGKAKAAVRKEAKAKKAGKPGKEAATPRPASKGAKVLELISRTKGATLGELMKATDWQAHSIRGFISGALGKKLGLTVEFAKREDGERVYSLAK